MKDKIKVLFIHPRKRRRKTSAKTLTTLIQMEVPDLYEFSDVYLSEDIIGQVEKQRPEIIFMCQHKSFNAIETLKKIKQVHSSAAVFVVLSNMIKDEQETINAFLSAGAYKCYFATLVIDTLIHDMYVCLNLE